jgi:prolyl-tRNA synthetase
MTDNKTNKKYEICPKEEDHGKWYQSILMQSDMIDYTSVSGCYVLKPLALNTWEIIKQYLDTRIRSMGVENYYFPLFVTKTNLEKESSHFDDFTPEVAWIVTKDPLVQQKIDKDQEIRQIISKLKEKGLDVNLRTNESERYAIRPTSETIIYPHFADWIKKNGKYPKINQWANCVRWENSQVQPFIRTREFLWQEGHTCHPTKDDALKEVCETLNMYKTCYESLLAVPMIDGYKTKSETFPGAELTTTIEGFLPDSGRGIQAATSHYLGTKFSHIFDIKDSNGKMVHQNSWGFTTRSIGVMVMTHSDNRGMVFPPAVAPTQVVMVACGLNSKTTDDERKNIKQILHDLCESLNSAGIRALFDDEPGDNSSPGMKFNKWETRGVPMRIEFGPRDLQNDTALFVRRFNNANNVKDKVKFSQIDCKFVKNYLQDIQDSMRERAVNRIQSNLKYCTNDAEIISALNEKKLILVDWNDENNDGVLETRLKQLCKDNKINSTKVLCIPNTNALDQFGFKFNHSVALFGRAY